ncbi:MAG: DUF3263 domain-containing protein [Acidimicrobiia bacterium]|nr:DUF3263 domain-containing protein [Acidimicrobiia bacterium]
MLVRRDTQVLDFEREWWKYPGPKDRAIREYLGISSTRYYQILRRLMDDPAAVEHDPMTIRRLRRVRQDAKRKAQERLGASPS